MDWIELDNEWNRYITYISTSDMKQKPVCDPRTDKTKFVHIQIRAADHYDAEKLWKITNLPVEEWGKDRWCNIFRRGKC